MYYYHGGQAGLRVGDLLLPPTESGATAAVDCLSDASIELQERAAKVVRRDMVYLTTSPNDAALFAALHPSGTDQRGGDVYRAVPLGASEPDPDYDGPAIVIRCAQARITAIDKTGVRRKPYLDARDLR